MTGIRLRKGESIRVQIMVELLGASSKPRRRKAPLANASLPTRRVSGSRMRLSNAPDY